MTLVLTTPPAVEPISLAEAKAHLRLESGSADTLVASLIVTSRLHIETVLGLALVTQGWTWLIDAWPDLAVLRLPMRPVQSISAVRVYAEDGSVVSLPADSYLLDGNGAPARFVRRRGRVWPMPGRNANGIEIAFVAGFGAQAADVPEDIRHALLLLVAHWYANREPMELGSPAVAIPEDISRLLKPYRALRL
jgi:uncharacterized phiE125 gp8 family phage protein